MIVILAILVTIISYFFGCFSTARLIAKSFRSLDVYKLGTGLADTENIYYNISKSMGVLAGALDLGKAYVYMMVVEFVLRILDKSLAAVDLSSIYSYNLMLVYGLGMLIGHCLPISHKFRGGRGILTYMGVIGYFSPLTVFITAILAGILVWGFKQVRFAQYTIVILPVVLYQMFYSFLPSYPEKYPPHFNLILMGTALFMGGLNIMVSKKLGEI